nr:hypothetical protein [Tanacetum cinerariifolium]
MRSKKAKEKGVAFRNVEGSLRPTTILPTIDQKDKGNNIMQEFKKPPKNPRKAQIQLDKDLAKRMHKEEMDELERRQSEIAAAEEAKQEQFTIKEKSRTFVEMIVERKRFFVVQRAAEKRSKPPTKAQMKNRMCTYLKNQAGYNHNQLNSKQAGSKKKREGLKLKSKSPNKLKVMKEQESAMDEQEKEELRLCLKIVQDEDKAINYETLAVKSLIVDWESQLLGSDLQREDLSYWKITRADGSFRFYKVFLTMLEEFNKQDLFDLHRLVIKRLKADLESTMAFELIRFIKA